MFERFNDRSRRVVVLAQEEARLLSHNYIGTEHLLLGLVHNREGVGARALESAGISLEAVRIQVETVVGRGELPPSGHIPFTARAKKVLEGSLREALQLGHDYIGTEHVLLSLLKEEDGVARAVLETLGADLARVRDLALSLAGEDPPGNLGTTVVTSALQRAGRVAMDMAAGRDACSFCGRDLWEVERHIESTSARICEDCVRACQGVIEDASSMGTPVARPLRLPPRVFGPEPPDEMALNAVVDAFTRGLGVEGTDEERARHLQDGATVAPLLRQAGARFQQLAGAVVHQVRFVEPTRAQVRFAILLGRNEVPFEGEAIREGDRWRVSRNTVSQMLLRAGVPPSTSP